MKTLFLSILSFFSGFFVQHSHQKTISVIPTTSVSPTPTALSSTTPTIVYYKQVPSKPTVTPIPSNCTCNLNNCTCYAIEIPAKEILGCTENCRPVPTQTMQEQINEMQSEIQQIKNNQ